MLCWRMLLGRFLSTRTGPFGNYRCWGILYHQQIFTAAEPRHPPFIRYPTASTLLPLCNAFTSLVTSVVRTSVNSHYPSKNIHKTWRLLVCNSLHGIVAVSQETIDGTVFEIALGMMHDYQGRYSGTSPRSARQTNSKAIRKSQLA